MGNYSKIPLPIELSCDGSQSLLGFLHTNQDLKSKTLTETVTEQDCHHDKLFPVLFFFYGICFLLLSTFILFYLFDYNFTTELWSSDDVFLAIFCKLGLYTLLYSRFMRGG